jgi:hypothetical protein
VEAQRDFWLADTDLTYVTIAPLDGPSAIERIAAQSGRTE